VIPLVSGRLPELRDQAKGRWRSILPRFDIPAAFLDGKQHPCPVCGGKDRARFDDKDGQGTWICNQCGAGDGVALVMKVAGYSFQDAAARIRELLPDAPAASSKPPRDDARCLEAARRVWSESVPMGGTMAEAYLRSRGCWRDDLGEVLRFVPRLRSTKHDAGFLPAMIAKVAGPDGHGVNVHRTFLENGRKAYRAMMPGAVPPGSAIRLGPVTPTLGVAEGIETSLHAAAHFGLPVWATISAGGMERWEPPHDVQRVAIFGDHDRSFSGQASAYLLARKLTNRRAPVTCDVLIPGHIVDTTAVGADWAVSAQPAKAA
jgi:putative DNA primase/helicase